MKAKIVEMLGSVRFWQSTCALILTILAYYQVIPWELAGIIAGWLGVGLVTRTIDKSNS